MRFSLFTKNKPKKVSITTTSITIDGNVIPYTLRLHSRVKYLRITMYRTGKIGVSAPQTASKHFIEKCLIQKKEWILSKLEYYKALPPPIQPSDTKKEYESHKESALLFVKKKVGEINAHYNFAYNEVHIKNQKTLWGSCSRRGNLNFNYKIALIREELAEYIVAHELCHLKEFNHSEKFWNLVGETIPHHKELRKELKTLGKIA